MAREWMVEDFDPTTDPMLDCSSAESAEEGYADDAALDGLEESS